MTVLHFPYSMIIEFEMLTSAITAGRIQARFAAADRRARPGGPTCARAVHARSDTRNAPLAHALAASHLIVVRLAACT